TYEEASLRLEFLSVECFVHSTEGFLGRLADTFDAVSRLDLRHFGAQITQFLRHLPCESGSRIHVFRRLIRVSRYNRFRDFSPVLPGPLSFLERVVRVRHDVGAGPRPP